MKTAIFQFHEYWNCVVEKFQKLLSMFLRQIKWRRWEIHGNKYIFTFTFILIFVIMYENFTPK